MCNVFSVTIQQHLIFLFNLTPDDDDEEGEGYLDIVPDTSPQDVANEVKQSTVSRSVQ